MKFTSNNFWKESRLIKWLGKPSIKEIILATNPTMEGEATACISQKSQISNLKSQTQNHEDRKGIAGWSRY